MISCGDLMIKVCGLTRQEDVDLCLSLRVCLTGFIFHPASPRYITPENAGAIDSGTAMRVGIFVDQSPDEVRTIMKTARLHLAQLHGKQDVEFCQDLGREKVMKVLWPDSYPDEKTFRADVDLFSPHTRFFLFDAGKSGGGHGKTISSGFLAGLKMPKTWFLAGGLSPDTIEPALAVCSPCGVDLNSGVESAPGVKDHDKLRRVIDFLCKTPK